MQRPQAMSECAVPHPRFVREGRTQPQVGERVVSNYGACAGVVICLILIISLRLLSEEGTDGGNRGEGRLRGQSGLGSPG